MAHAITIPNITIVSCYDGDTCRVDLPRSAFNDDWAYELFGHNIPIRVEGIDTPEIRGKCQKEKDLAYEARDLVRGLLDNAQSITLSMLLSSGVREGEMGKGESVRELNRNPV